MARPDPFLTLLKDIGFLTVRLPRGDVRPLQMIEKDGKDLNLMGDLENAMASPAGATAPQVVQDIPAAQLIQGQQTSKIKLNIGLTLLGNILSALTGQNLNVSAAFQKASTVTFEFADVTVDKVDIILLDRFLNLSDINPDARAIHDLLLDGRMGVITATARTKKYLVSAQRDDGSNVGIDVPTIKGVAGGNLAVESAATGSAKVAFEGSTPLAFGLQGILISFDQNGRFTAFDPLKAGEGAARGLDLAAVPNFLTSPAIFADLRKR